MIGWSKPLVPNGYFAASGVGPTITTATLPDGNVAAAYSQALAASGGTLPLVWSVLSGSVPAGLALSAAGVLSGTPTTVAAYTFTVKVQDNVGRMNTRAYTVSIAAALGPSRLFVAGRDSTPAGAAYYDLVGASWHALADLPGSKYMDGGDWPGSIHLDTFGGKIAFMGCKGSNVYLYVYDIATNAWSSFNCTTGGDDCGCGEVLTSGRYLVGYGWSGAATKIYDPVANTVSNGASGGNIYYQLSCVLASGKVLLVSCYTNVTHIFTDNGGAGSWTTGADLPANYVHGGCVRLLDGRVMYWGPVAQAYCGTPTITAWGAVTSAPASVVHHQGVVLPDGRVVLAGGSSRKIYIYTPGAWSPGDAPNLNPGSWATATQLTLYASNQGQVLYSTVTGKVYVVGNSPHVSVWDPVADTIADLVIPGALNVNYPLGILY
jgi:hypothetical protein